MASNGNQEINPWFVIGLLFLGLVMLLDMLGGKTAGSSAPQSSSTSAPTSQEYRYARERFRQEGFSNSDADTAARAVIKFHEAQKAR